LTQDKIKHRAGNKQETADWLSRALERPRDPRPKEKIKLMENEDNNIKIVNTLIKESISNLNSKTDLLENNLKNYILKNNLEKIYCDILNFKDILFITEDEQNKYEQIKK